MMEEKKLYKAKPHQISVDRLKAKIKKLTSRKWSVSMSYRMTKLNQVIRGWVNYYRIGQMKTVCKEIDAHMRFRLRMCIWKQWKKIGKRYKSLIKLGIDKNQAWQWANTRKSYARVAMSFIMHIAVNNEILRKRGLVFLLDHYQLVRA